MTAVGEDGTTDEDTVKKAQILKEKTGVTYPLLIPDAGNMNGRISGLSSFPESFFVDKDGNIGFIHISGYIDNDAGYTNSDIVNYITNNLQITGLTLVGTEEDECIHDEQGMGGI